MILYWEDFKDTNEVHKSLKGDETDQPGTYRRSGHVRDP